MGAPASSGRSQISEDRIHVRQVRRVLAYVFVSACCLFEVGAGTVQPSRGERSYETGKTGKLKAKAGR